MKNGCVPFDQMPFASSLVQHIPTSTALYESIDSNDRDYEFLARYLQANMDKNSRLYLKEDDISERFSQIDKLIDLFNEKLYKPKHEGREIQKFGKNLYVKQV